MLVLDMFRNRDADDKPSEKDRSESRAI